MFGDRIDNGWAGLNEFKYPRKPVFSYLWVVIFLALGLVLVACGEDRADSTPAGGVVDGAETALPTEAGPTLAETVAPAVSATLPPAPTLEPPTATLAPTAAETATPEPVLLLTEADFGDNRNPLTGEVVTDTAALQRHPIAVKLSNSPAQYTRPQAGLGQADLVFEHPTEGPITRFTAVFYSQTPPDVGPIRSARLIDVEIPAMYDAALAYSGASIGVSRKLGGADFRARLLRSNEPGYYRTGEDKPWEHTLHGNPEAFWQALAAKGENQAPVFGNFMAFSSEPPEGGEPAGTVTVKYRDWTTVEWRYDPENGRYWRWTDGEVHADANSGEQVSAANVVAVFAIHQLDMSICEYQVGDTCQAFSTEIQIWGQGPAIVFRDGRGYEVTWKRENRGDMLTFYDEAGHPVPLQIGNTWFQVVPLHYVDPVTITP